MKKSYELAIIGTGPGGYAAALRAAQLGIKVISIDRRSRLGGTCLNMGCIPSKTLLFSTNIWFDILRNLSIHGIELSNPTLNFPKLMRRKEGVVEMLADGVGMLFKKHDIPLLHGEASFIDSNRIQVNTMEGPQEIIADNIIIATGSEPIELKGFPFDERRVLSSTGALCLQKIPESMLIIGGGVIGAEMASIYSKAGSKVTVVEMLPYICSGLDLTLSKHLLPILKKQGIDILISTRVISAVLQPDEVIVTVEGEGKLQNLNARTALVSIGRKPHTDGLNLKAAGVKLDERGYIPVDDHFRTSQANIFAVGDVIPGIMLAHKATAEGITVVEWLKGINTSVNYVAIPNVVYTVPEAASVGLTEEEARQNSLEIDVGVFSLRGNPRARCMGEIEGLVKVIGEKKTGKLIGMHILCEEASELINQGVIAIQAGMRIEDLAAAPYAHPTLGEAIKEAALSALGKPLHH